MKFSKNKKKNIKSDLLNMVGDPCIELKNVLKYMLDFFPL